MTRFEEVQMRIAESAKNHLEIFNMQVFIEQFTLDRESKFSLTLPDMEPPFFISAVVSFMYDAFQTGMTLYEEEGDESDMDIDTSIELEFTVKLPYMEGDPAVEELLEEIKEEYPDTEPVLSVREVLMTEDSSKEYEISYIYNIEAEDVMDPELLDQIFGELKDIMQLSYSRTKDYIDPSWYREDE